MSMEEENETLLMDSPVRQSMDPGVVGPAADNLLGNHEPEKAIQHEHSAADASQPRVAQPEGPEGVNLTVVNATEDQGCEADPGAWQLDPTVIQPPATYSHQFAVLGHHEPEMAMHEPSSADASLPRVV